MSDPQMTLSRAELSLIVHRLLDMAATHERLADEDDYADTELTLEVASAREGLLCADLLREAASALEARA